MATSGESGDAANDAATNGMLGKTEKRMGKILAISKWEKEQKQEDIVNEKQSIESFKTKHEKFSTEDNPNIEEIKSLDSDIDEFITKHGITVDEQIGGRRRSSSARKSSSRRGRRSAKKRGTKRKQKRRQRRASRRAY